MKDDLSINFRQSSPDKPQLNHTPNLSSSDRNLTCLAWVSIASLLIPHTLAPAKRENPQTRGLHIRSDDFEMNFFPAPMQGFCIFGCYFHVSCAHLHFLTPKESLQPNVPGYPRWFAWQTLHQPACHDVFLSSWLVKPSHAAKLPRFDPNIPDSSVGGTA